MASNWRKGEASRTPGTYGDSLWLLPSGPDQIHETAMRGGPPLIGAHRASGDYSVFPTKRSMTMALRRYNGAVSFVDGDSCAYTIPLDGVAASTGTSCRASPRSRCCSRRAARRPCRHLRPTATR